jgi:hypothetical protein
MKPLALYRILAFQLPPGEWVRQTGTVMFVGEPAIEGSCILKEKALVISDANGVRIDIDVDRIEIQATEEHPTRSEILCKRKGAEVARFIAYKQLPLTGDVVRMAVVRVVANPKARTDGEAEVVRG